MNPIQRFNNDTTTKGMVLDYVLQYLDKLALEKVYKGEGTSEIRQAKITIEQAFAQMDADFKVVEPREPVNESR